MTWNMPRPARIPTTGRARKSALRPAGSAPVHLYTKLVDVPLTAGQATTTLDQNGNGQVSVGPSGIGSVWIPASAVTSTTTGLSNIAADPSTCNVYIGPAGTPTALQGTLFPGTGVVGLAIPQLTPGLYIIAVWSGGVPGDTAALNVTGTASVLSRE